MSNPNYWAVDVPGLDSLGAQALARAAIDNGAPVGATAVDPKQF
ncbi:hypothetical protein [Nakamurella antarctica]|nr:hypothetical protein [Nakamurella antarctica]